MTAGLPAPASRAAVIGRRVALIFSWLLLSLYYVQPIREVLAPNLDSSIRATYAYFTAHGFQFGPEVNTTAGPYGFVMFGWDYCGELFWSRFVLSLLCSGALAALVLWFFTTAKRGGLRWFWLASLICGLDLADNQFNASILLSGVYLLIEHDRADRRIVVALVTAFLALLSLMKGTQLALAIGTIGTVAALAAGQRSWRSAGWIIGSYGLALLAWWAAAGQNPLHLPSYINGIRHIAQGYNEAMALNEPRKIFLVGVSLLAVLATSLGAIAWRGRTQFKILAGCVLLSGMAWVCWKHGFVRADGHVLVFFDIAGVIALTLLVLESRLAPTPVSVFGRIARGILGASAIGLGLFGAEKVGPGRTRGVLTGVTTRLSQNFDFVTQPVEVKHLRDGELIDRRRLHDRGAIRKLVNQRSIDFFGYETGLLLLNGLNYRPPPMCCGTYHVYNRYFKELNLQHFSDPQARPDFILLKIQSIDYRFAPIDDSLSLMAFLDLYRPILCEDETLLLEERKDAPPPQKPRPIGSLKIKFDEDIVVPEVGDDDLVLFSVTLPSSVAGSLRAFVYKPPQVFLNLEGDGLTEPPDRRVLPESLVLPSLLSPALEKTEDFVNLYSRGGEKKIRRFRLHTAAPECFRLQDMVVTFSVIRRPPALPPGEIRRVSVASVYHDPPDAVDPPNALVHYYKNMRVQFLHTPASVTYRLHGDERQLSFIAGIDENAYSNGGRTDGVDFYIELHEPGSPPRILTRRYLQPLTVPADRGTHRLVGVLPPVVAPGSTLVVRADPGPRHDTSWDWSFGTAFTITRGPYIQAQFPHFSRLPVSCDGLSVSPMSLGSREITMVVARGGMTFTLGGKEQLLTFTGGLLEASYMKGDTDGAGFLVDLEFLDGHTQRLFSRQLQPKTVAADRGDQTFSIPIPAVPPGTRLHLRSDPGPAGNAAFDWVYISELQLR